MFLSAFLWLGIGKFSGGMILSSEAQPYRGKTGIGRFMALGPVTKDSWAACHQPGGGATVVPTMCSQCIATIYSCFTLQLSIAQFDSPTALISQSYNSSTMYTERWKSEPIAIIGSGCRLPGGATSPSKLWDLLQNPRDLLSNVSSANRFNTQGFYHEDGDHHGVSTGTRHILASLPVV